MLLQDGSHPVKRIPKIGFHGNLTPNILILYLTKNEIWKILFCHKIEDNFPKIYKFNGYKYLPIITPRYLPLDLSCVEDMPSVTVKTSLRTLFHFKCYFPWWKFNPIEKRIFKITSFLFSIFPSWRFHSLPFLFLNSQNTLAVMQSQARDFVFLRCCEGKLISILTF